MGTTGVLGFNLNKIFTTNTKFYFKMYLYVISLFIFFYIYLLTYFMKVIIAVFVNILDVILFLQSLHVISNHCSSLQKIEYHYNVLHLIINHFILTKVILIPPQTTAVHCKSLKFIHHRLLHFITNHCI